MKQFDDREPVVVGLHGLAGSGKTSVADLLSPPGMNINSNEEDPNNDFNIWDHLSLAKPIYEIVSIKRKVQGESYKDRQRYEIHQVLADMFGSPLYGAPKYDQLVDLVNDLQLKPISMDEDNKPRSFMQHVGSACRQFHEDCFINYTRGTILKRAYALDAEHPDHNYIAVISDVRFENEARVINKFNNGIVIKFDASDETRYDRLGRRDGVVISPDESKHESEQGISDELITATINSDNINRHEQALATLEAITTNLEGFEAECLKSQLTQAIKKQVAQS